MTKCDAKDLGLRCPGCGDVLNGEADHLGIWRILTVPQEEAALRFQDQVYADRIGPPGTVDWHIWSEGCACGVASVRFIVPKEPSAHDREYAVMLSGAIDCSMQLKPFHLRNNSDVQKRKVKPSDAWDHMRSGGVAIPGGIGAGGNFTVVGACLFKQVLAHKSPSKEDMEWSDRTGLAVAYPSVSVWRPMSGYQADKIMKEDVQWALVKKSAWCHQFPNR